MQTNQPSEGKANVRGGNNSSLLGRSMQRKIMLLMVCCVAVSTVVVGIVAYNRVRTSAIEEAKQTLTVETRLLSQRFRNTYNGIARDLKILAGMPPIEGIIRSMRNDGVDPLDGSSLELWRERLATIFASVLTQRPDNFQIRYIGLADGGREIVRVDRRPAGSWIAAPRDLQRKAKEFYFRQGTEATPGQVVFSEVTYNREFGRRDPRNIPTMRGILPIHDESGDLFGMLVINVDYGIMLRNAFAEMRPREHTIVVNGQGDYMEHPGGIGNPPGPLEMHGAYTRTPPPIIRQILSSPGAQGIFENENTVSFAINNDEGHGEFNDQVSIVIQVPKSELYAKANRTGAEVLTAGSVVVLFFIIGSVFFARALMEPLSRTAIAIVENVTDGLILIDRNGTIERFNPGCEHIFGYTASEVIGQPASMLMTEREIASHEADLERYTAGKVCDLIGATIEIEGRRKDGEIVPIEVSINELNLNGRVKFTGVMRDISERREMERVKTEFISTVSHELRTPLTSIRGSLGLVGKMLPTGLPGSVYQMVTLAQKNTSRLITLVNDILDFEKLASNEVKYEFETACIQEELAQAAELIKGYADQFRVKVTYSAPEKPFHVSVDLNRFQQILANLLSNAVKFSPASGEVTIEAKAGRDNVHISITDRGEGIPEEFREQIFNPFSQADSTSSRKKGGTGLGLSITKKLVEGMHGKISYESTIGEGTTFLISFPRVQSPRHADQIGRAANDTRLVGLHLEDDKDFAAVLAATFRDIIILKQASDISAARAHMKTERFDLIIIDVALRSENGLDFLDDVPSDTTVVLITALDEYYDDPRIDLVIIKSKTEPGEIQDKIMSLLVERRAHLKAAAQA